jgi:putative addiction module killer protein
MLLMANFILPRERGHLQILSTSAIWDSSDFGPGYRLYYKQENDRVVILLCGGSKRKQEEDIRTAKRLAKELSGGDPQ